MSWRNPNKRDRTGRMLRYSSPVDAGMIDPAVLADVVWRATGGIDQSSYGWAVTLPSGSIVDTNPPPGATHSYLSTGAQNAIIGDSTFPIFGTNDFSMRYPIRVNAFSSDFAMGLARREGSTLSFNTFLRSGAIVFDVNGIFPSYTVSIATNTWYTLTTARKNGLVQISIDGTVVDTITNGGNAIQ
jgi:hypothetical protein